MKKFLKFLEPSEDAVKRTKTVFLSAFQEKFPKAQFRPSPAFRYFISGAATGVAFMVVISGAAVYADGKNVGPDHPLYSLKRSQESLTVFVAEESDRPALHLKFAERRRAEVETVRSSSPESAKIATLVEDLEDEVKQSLGTIVGDLPDDAEEEILESLDVDIGPEDEKSETDLIESEAVSAPSFGSAATASGIGASQPPLPLPIKHGDERDDDIKRHKSGEKKSGSSNVKRDDERDKNSKRHKDSEKKSGPSKKKLSICESWQGLLADDGEDVKRIREIVSEHPEFLEKFEEKCHGFLTPRETP